MTAAAIFTPLIQGIFTNKYLKHEYSQVNWVLMDKQLCI